MKKSTSLLLVSISFSAIAVSLLTYVFLHAPSTPTAALAKIELAKTKELNVAGFGTNYADIFTNYTSWPSSPILDATDTVLQSLYLLPTSRNGYQYGTNYYSQVDINGDGLVDIIVHDQLGDATYVYKRFFAVFLNQGNLQFNLTYKCVVDQKDGGVYTYYGDCAQ